MTGHQPELYHPGIWIKDFLVDRVSADTGCTGIDLVVDSDAFVELAADTPCMQPDVRRCRTVLAEGGKETCYACAPVPSEAGIAEFLVHAEEKLASLSNDEPLRSFERFGACLRDAAADARNLAELVTFARRRYEASAGTRYLEVPATALGTCRAFAAFVLDIAWRAEEFVAAYNAELDAFREATATRSKAQPFPNLARDADRFELPFWVIGGNMRRTLWVGPPADGTVALFADDEEIGRVAEGDVETGCPMLERLGIAPKALTLTLYCRVFVADLFVHGTGGARYDRVTDAVIRRLYGIGAPAYVVASLTERMPLEFEHVSDAEVAAASELANRFEHNPDEMLDEIEMPDPEARARAAALAAEKSELVSLISEVGADRKALGGRIREVNAELRESLAPYGEALRREAERLGTAREAARILEDRTYPFCYWPPESIAAHAR